MTWLSSVEPVILTVHYIICVFIIIVILLQAGKGADMGATFGVGSSQTLFGARGAATLLSKITTVVSLLFLCTSISLAAIHKYRSTGVLDESVVEVDGDSIDMQLDPDTTGEIPVEGSVIPSGTESQEADASPPPTEQAPTEGLPVEELPKQTE